jgi:hypothetical protein
VVPEPLGKDVSAKCVWKLTLDRAKSGVRRRCEPFRKSISVNSIEMLAAKKTSDRLDTVRRQRKSVKMVRLDVPIPGSSFPDRHDQFPHRPYPATRSTTRYGHRLAAEFVSEAQPPPTAAPAVMVSPARDAQVVRDVTPSPRPHVRVGKTAHARGQSDAHRSSRRSRRLKRDHNHFTRRLRPVVS